MRFFHFAPMKLGPGSIIEPGNFGRILQTIPPMPGNDGSYLPGYIARELAFELVRERDFSSKPSRFSCIFGCPTLEDANRYSAVNNLGNRQVLHEVEAVDENAYHHIGSLSFCDISYGVAFVTTVFQNATGYWSAVEGDAAKGKELIAETPIRIIKSI
jgi:hypothetical protein